MAGHAGESIEKTVESTRRVPADRRTFSDQKARSGRDAMIDHDIGAQSRTDPLVAPASTAPVFVPDRRVPHRPRRRIQRSYILEPRSLTDARALVDGTAGAFASARRARQMIQPIPLVMMLTDIGAFAIVAALVPRSAEDACMFAAMVFGCRLATRQYRPRLTLTVLDDLPRTLGAILCGVGLTLALSYVLERGRLHGQDLLDRAVALVLSAVALQSLAFAVARRLRRRAQGRRTLIVGAGSVAATLAAALDDHPDLGLKPVGYTDMEGANAALSARLPLIAVGSSDLARTIVDNDIDTTIIAFDGAGEQHVDAVIAAHQTGCNILIVPAMYELHHDRPDVERVRGIPLLRLRPDPTSRPTWWIKRAVDVTVATLVLVALALPLGVIALATLIDQGRPILFWQERIGLDGVPFRLCKFTSLRPTADGEAESTWNIADDPRVSRLGRLLRRWSIDEIPQLWNVVRGEMSLVGPRPERPSFVRTFTVQHARYWARHRVPSGMTGLAQVNGLRGDTSILERARYDNYYIANWSLWLDVKIMLLTAREVLGGHGR